MADNIKSVVGAIPEFVYKAQDNYDNVICEVSWSDGALDENGKLVEGTHTMTLTATDLTGNSSTKNVTVKVGKTSIKDLIGDKDVVEPTTPAEPTDPKPQDKSGCSGNVDFSPIIIVLAIVACVSIIVFEKREKKNK